MTDWLVRKLSSRYPQSRVRRWVGRLPGNSAERLGHQLAEAYFRRYMKETLGHFMIAVDEGPLPPEELIMKTFVLDEKDKRRKLSGDFYFAAGYREILWWLQTAERYGFNLRTAGAIMELGVGTARLLRHLRCIDGIRLVGTDLYGPNIDWCMKAFPDLEFHQNSERPPLKFAADDTFDFVYAASVFTHIPLETQALWIAEMRRILKPGGFLVCNVLGRFHQEVMLGKEGIARLHRDGNLTVTKDDANASLATKLIGSWDVFQTRQEVLKVFGKHFTVCDYMPAQIDTLVLRKPDDAR